MSKIAIASIAVITTLNFIVAFYMINQPMTEINHYTVHQLPVKQCTVEVDKEIVVEI